MYNKNMKQTTDFDKRLLALARDDAVVYNAISYYLENNMTVEQALTEIVLVFAKINKQQFELLLKEKQMRPAIGIHEFSELQKRGIPPG